MSKTIMIIGAGPGIAQATAERFARAGFRVILASRNPQRHSAMLRKMDELNAEVVLEKIDASDATQVAELVGRYADSLDVLHYNAGVLHYGADGSLSMRRLSDETVASIVSDTQINISSAMVAIGAAIPPMARRGSGTILLTGGGLGVSPSADLLTLSVGKAGIRSMTQGLFEPLKAQGIHIATVTVATLVSPESTQSAGVGDAFWNLYAEKPTDWTWETPYS